MNAHPLVDAHVAGEAVRALIRESLPGAEEYFESKMPVYKVRGAWTAACHVLDRFDARLGKRRSGKSCVELSPELLPLAGEILAEAARES